MKTKLITIFVAVFGLAASPVLLAQGCCGGGEAMKEGCSMGVTGAEAHVGHGGTETTVTAQSAAPKAVFAQPVQTVFDNYIRVQGALARDSIEGVSEAASAMAKAIQSDSKKTLSSDAAHHAEALAKTRDLKAARAAFKSLSESLIQFVKGQKAAAGTYHVAYCPMAKASWLQTDSAIANPYMGKAMIHCGQFRS